MPLVTVIIPNYNHEKFLHQRIESVLCQTFQDFEIIIFDDNSTDNSIDVLNSYKNNPKVSHFIINEVNSGSPFKQWQRGLDLAKGKYLWIAETDDFANQDFLKHTVSELEKEASASLCYTDSVIVNGQGVEIGLWSLNKNIFFKTQKWSTKHTNNGLDEILDFLLYKVTINNISAVLFSTTFFKKLDFDALGKFKNAGDLFTYISLCLQGDVCYIPLPLNNYREHENNITKLNVANGIIYKERLDCFNFVLDHLNKNNLSIKENKRIKKALYYFMNKNIFGLLDFKYNLELNSFLVKCKSLNLINTFQYNSYSIASKMYYLKMYKSKGLSRRIIKKIFTK
jgi:glycosyltransferase involved in cell wall biosynthesis